MNSKKIVALTGGIGSGKSVVSSVLRLMGYKVYDCDSEAKCLMNRSDVIKTDLVEAFGEDCLTKERTINSKYISSVVFKDSKALAKINSIVHPRVKEDILYNLGMCDNRVMFVETAILMQSNLLDIVDDVWLVDAPEQTRIERVMRRNSIKAEDVKARINAQKHQDFSSLSHYEQITNDGLMPLLPQIEELVQRL